MVLKFGGWFELECSESYAYARIGRREVFIQLAEHRRGYSTAVRLGHAQRSTFRVVL
jgi:hypothetical protein